jgi:hypothetical protein
MRTKERMLAAEPKFTKSKTEHTLPILAKDRTESVLLNCNWPRTLMQPPMRPKLMTLMVEPMRTMLRTDMVEPKCT